MGKKNKRKWEPDCLEEEINFEERRTSIISGIKRFNSKDSTKSHSLFL